MRAIVDNTVLTNFALAQQSEFLKVVGDGELFTAQEVLSEFQEGENRSIVLKQDWNWIQVLEIESEEERITFTRANQRLGKGEAACLSLAIHRQFKILTDDLDARRYAQRRGIPVSGTIGVLVLAVKKKLILLEEGNTILQLMLQYGYYSPYLRLDELI